MRVLLRLFAVIAVALGLVAPAMAQQMSPLDRPDLDDFNALTVRIQSFDAAVRANDMAAIMGVIPPKVLDKLAGNFGVTKDQLLDAAQQTIDAAMAEVDMVSFSMDLENATFYRLPSGTPYALIPTEAVMDFGVDSGGKIRASSTTLGLKDEGTWYLVRTEDAPTVAIVKEIYPEFAPVEFPTGGMEPVTE